MGRNIYGISKTEKDTVAMNGRDYYFNHLEKIDEKKYNADKHRLFTHFLRVSQG